MKAVSGKLFVVGTPIGNLEDISLRAVRTLKEVDFIAAEDTRVSLRLLNHLGVRKPLVSYHEHNKLSRGEAVCSRLEAGESCALVSDAGMPAISDPGADLVKLCCDRNIPVEVVPGASAVVSAVAVSGLDTSKFVFEGFLSADKKKREAEIRDLADQKRTLVFYEAPHRLLCTLKSLYSCLGDRDISIVKELTKIHEKVFRTTLKRAASLFSETALKGEFVLVVSGAKSEETAPKYSLDDAVNLAKGFVKEGCCVNEAAKLSAKETGIKKSDIYRGLL